MPDKIAHLLSAASGSDVVVQDAATLGAITSSTHGGHFKSIMERSQQILDGAGSIQGNPKNTAFLAAPVAVSSGNGAATRITNVFDDASKGAARKHDTAFEEQASNEHEAYGAQSWDGASSGQKKEEWPGQGSAKGGKGSDGDWPGYYAQGKGKAKGQEWYSNSDGYYEGKNASGKGKQGQGQSEKGGYPENTGYPEKTGYAGKGGYSQRSGYSGKGGSAEKGAGSAKGYSEPL